MRAREGAGPVTPSVDISYIYTVITHAAAIHGVKISTEQVGLARVALRRLELRRNCVIKNDMVFDRDALDDLLECLKL